MGMYDWGAPLNLNTGNNWGMLPQFQSIAGYGMPSSEVPDFSNGITSMGGPAGAIGSVGDASPGAIVGFEPTFMQQLMGYTDTTNGMKVNGLAGPAMGLISGGLGAFMGMKQYGLAKEALAQSKRQFNLNYAAQKQTTNAALEDRQRARNASNPGAYQATDDYMAQYGIK